MKRQVVVVVVVAAAAAAAAAAGVVVVAVVDVVQDDAPRGYFCILKLCRVRWSLAQGHVLDTLLNR